MLTERIRHFAGRQKEINFIFSENPCKEGSIDLFILPADKLRGFFSKNVRIKNWLPKVIAFGSQLYLKQAFLLGCTDYLKEPWDINEFQIRINLVIKRILAKYSFTWGRLHFKNKKLSSAGEEIRLSYQEMVILKILLQFREEVVPREVLFYSIWDNPGSSESRIIDVHISSIRKKLQLLQPDISADRIIRSVRGKGYIIGE